MILGPHRKTRVALAVAALSGSLCAHAQDTPVPPPGPGGGGGGNVGGSTVNTAPTLDDASPLAATVTAGASVLVPLPAPGTRGGDAEGDALAWAFAAAPGEARTDVDGGSAMLNGDRLSFFPAADFTGRTSVALVLVETATEERLSSAASLPVVVTVDEAAAADGPQPDAPEPDEPGTNVPEPAVPEPDDVPEPDEAAPAPDAPEPEEAPEPDAPEPDDVPVPDASGAVAPESDGAPEPDSLEFEMPDPDDAPEPEAPEPEPAIDDDDDAGMPVPAASMDVDPEPSIQVPASPSPGPDDGSASMDVPDVDPVGDVVDAPPGGDDPEPDGEPPATATAEDAETDGNGTLVPVGGLRLVAASDRAIAIAWEASPNSVTTVERDGVQIAAVEGGRFVDTDVVAGERYVYTLGADASGGRVLAQALTDNLGADVRSPAAPGEVLALRRGDGSVVVAWQGGGDDRSVAGYDLYRNGRYFTTVYATAYVDADAPDTEGTLYDVVSFDEARNYSPRSVATFVDGRAPSIDGDAGTVVVTTDASGRFSFAPVNRSPSVIVLVGDDAATSLWPTALPGGATAGGFVTRDANPELLVLPAFGTGQPSGLEVNLQGGKDASGTLVFDPAAADDGG